MSIKAMQWVFEHSKTVGSARVLMLAIADRANDDGVCWPDKANLAKKVNVTERTIIKLVRQCEELGELSVALFYRGKERRTANRYIMMALAPAEVRATATPIVTVPLPPKMENARRRRGLKGEHDVTPPNRDARVTPPVNTSSPGGVNTSSPDSSVDSSPIPHTGTAAKAPSKRASKQKESQPRSEVEHDPIYEYVEELMEGYVGGPDQPYNWRSNVGQFADWLKGRIGRVNRSDVGKIKSPAGLHHLDAFKRWFRDRHEGLTFPRDPIKAVSYWRQFAYEVRSGAYNKPVPNHSDWVTFA